MPRADMLAAARDLAAALGIRELPDDR
jgi:hypothetical protein